jgi:hypothetical protein
VPKATNGSFAVTRSGIPILGWSLPYVKDARARITAYLNLDTCHADEWLLGFMCLS